jgi:hypothetical protein
MGNGADSPVAVLRRVIYPLALSYYPDSLTGQFGIQIFFPPLRMAPATPLGESY